jgi:hypothetical protein
VFRRWEVFNKANPNDAHVSYHFFYVMAKNKVNDLDSMRRALGFSAKHHEYLIRRPQ